MRLDLKTWNELLDRNEIQSLPDKQGNGRLMIFQVFRGKVKWKDKIYRATGWSPPNSSPYVELVEA